MLNREISTQHSHNLENDGCLSTPVIPCSTPGLRSANESSQTSVSQNVHEDKGSASTLVPAPNKKFKSNSGQDIDVRNQSLDNDEAKLRDAGRNMRYCEEEDKFVNEHSRTLAEFMETSPVEGLEEYLLSDKELRFFVVMDIVYPALKKSICFTKRSV